MYAFLLILAPTPKAFNQSVFCYMVFLPSVSTVVTRTSPLRRRLAATAISPPAYLFKLSTSSFPNRSFCSGVSPPGATTTSRWYLAGYIASLGALYPPPAPPRALVASVYVVGFFSSDCCSRNSVLICTTSFRMVSSASRV